MARRGKNKAVVALANKLIRIASDPALATPRRTSSTAPNSPISPRRTAAQLWCEQIANVRIHGEAHQHPLNLFAQERASLKTPNPNAFDLARVLTQCASSQFRVRLDTDRYSVPAQYSSRRLTIKVYPDRLCIYDQDTLIAHHLCSYDRRQDIEDPEHPEGLLEQRKNAREQRLLCQFLNLSNHAQAY